MLKILFTCLLVLFNVNISIAKDRLRIFNASYDSTREVYQKINQQFINKYQTLYQQKPTILQSHSGSSKQARAIIEGMPASIVTLASEYDIDMLVENNFVDANWRELFPNNSSPYSSVIVFLVKKNNPKNIKDWDDLIRKDVKVITPNPKTSGAARWNYLVAWAYAMKKFNDKDLAKNFIDKLYNNVPILDTAARASSITFTKRKIGDVLITWENEASLILNNKNGEQYEIIAPSISINIQLPAVIINKNINSEQDRNLAVEYLKYLYSDESQEIFAKYYFRPNNLEVFKKNANLYTSVKNIINANELGTSKEIQAEHFENGALFDQIYGK
jgi:sulfate transport system substrate-binding protein